MACVVGVEDGTDAEQVARRPALLMMRRFALPKPSQARIDEAAGVFALPTSSCLLC